MAAASNHFSVANVKISDSACESIVVGAHRPSGKRCCLGDNNEIVYQIPPNQREGESFVQDVVRIPVGVKDLKISLTESDSAHEIFLNDEDERKDVVNWKTGFLHAHLPWSQESAKNFGENEGIPIEFSADRLTSPCKETLAISGHTTKALVLRIQSYLSTTSSILISYSYSAIVPCDGSKLDVNSPEHRERRLKGVFDAIAACGDVDPSSLPDIISCSGALSTKLAVLFVTFDVNADGYLSTHEFVEGVRTVPGIETVTFEGKPLTEAEFKRVAGAVGKSQKGVGWRVVEEFRVE